MPIHLAHNRRSEATFEIVIQAHLFDHGNTRLSSGHDGHERCFLLV